MQEEKLTPQARTFAAGLEFLETNHEQDNWYLQIETFDPHEPFFTLKQWKDRYNFFRAEGSDWDGPHFDWPEYARVTEDPDAVEYLRYQYAALLTQCDHYLGTVIDFMDAHDMWRDTMLLVVTDHGFLLGEHDWWGKMRMPWYNETAHIPLFAWDPARRRRRRQAAQPDHHHRYRPPPCWTTSAWIDRRIWTARRYAPPSRKTPASAIPRSMGCSEPTSISPMGVTCTCAARSRATRRSISTP